ncbi:MAG: hypothetical protein LIP01_01855 [Tannerellaceae bacterium]|nr:hypothetical protein [Tannerellaceae bacterium]
MIQAYRLYVLALAQTPEIGAMNRLRESTRQYAMSRWILASAYALTGRVDVANDLVKTTVAFDSYSDRSYDYTYGSSLRDKAMRLQALSLLKKTEEASVLVKEISATLSSDKWLSTQETAYALLGMSEFIGRYSTSDKMQFAYAGGGKKETINTDAHVWNSTLVKNGGETEKVEVNNTGRSTLFVQLITEGTPDQGEEEAYAKDVSVEVKYMEGSKPVDVSLLEQGTNFTAVVVVKNTTSRPMQTWY